MAENEQATAVSESEPVDSGLPAEAMEAIEKVNSEREAEYREVSGDDTSAGDEVSSRQTVADEDPGQQPEQQQPQVDEQLLARAQQYGLDGSKYSADDLRSRLDDFDRMFVERGKQYQAWQQQQWQQRQQMPPQQQQPGQPPQQQQQVPQQPDSVFGLGEEYDDLGEKLEAGAQKLQQQFYGVMDAMARHMLQQQQVVQQWQQQQQQAATQRMEDDFHKAVQTLGDKDLGGKPISELKQGSSEFNNLNTLRQHVFQMVLGMQQAGMQPPPLDQLVSQAYKLAFPDKYEQQVRQKFQQEARDASRSRMGTGMTQTRKHGINPASEEGIDWEQIRQGWDSMTT